MNEPPSTGALGSDESPSLNVTFSQRDAEHLGGDLGHHRIGAGTDVRGRAGDRRAAVDGQPRGRSPACCIASQLPVPSPSRPASLPRASSAARVTLPPAEPLCAGGSTPGAPCSCTACLRSGPCPSNCSAAARGDRSPARWRARPSRFRSRTGLQTARGPHVARGGQVERDDLVIESRVGASVEQARPVDDLLAGILVLEVCRGLWMNDGKPPSRSAPSASDCAVSGAMAEGEHLLPGQGHPHGTLERPRPAPPGSWYCGRNPEPNAPPTYGRRTRTSSGSKANTLPR